MRSTPRYAPFGHVEPFEVDDLVSDGNEVRYELVVTGFGTVDLRSGTELGVRTEDDVDLGSPLNRHLDVAG